MGMAASQARLLTLQARQSNLEYQGQQINQERTILSQQCTELYNSLLGMEVPTPPSTNDFTTIQYTGISGATKYTFEASDIKPSANNLYTITFNDIQYGNTLEANNGTKQTKKGSQSIPVSTLTVEAEKKYTQSELTRIYVEKDGSLVPLSSLVDDNSGGSEANGYLIKNPDGTYSLKTGGVTYYVPNSESEEEKLINSAGDKSNYTINGYQAYELDEEYVSNENGLLDGYREAINNFGLKNKDGIAYKPEDFYVYFDNEGNAHFALKTDVHKATDDHTNATVTYDYLPNGAISKPNIEPDCKITFDPSTGRILSVEKPVDRDENGAPTSYVTLKISSTTISDEMAYEDAFAQYEYQQYLYDKKQQEINAKTEVIQQQDRSLELKLQRLDNERTMIKTEIEAVDKVINENIEDSYKTFSG